MTGRTVLTLLVAVWLGPVVLAQSDRTDEFIRAEMKRQNIPGLSLAIVKDGTVIKAAGYGFANLQTKAPATAETVYRIASVSKQFIATGIMLLTQEGRLSVDDPLRKYLDDVPDLWRGITIRHLLTHSSGLPRDASGFDPWKTQSDAEVIRTAYRTPLTFAPGERSEYGNLNYYALAEVITRVSGRPWSAYMQEKVFRPLDMESTHPTNTRVVFENRAAGYVDNNELRPADDWPALRPSGAYLSTVLDLAKWDAALNTDTILSEASRSAMWTRGTLSNGRDNPYGFGWMIGSFRGRRLVHHSGGMLGFRARFARFVDDGLSIVVLMNLDDVDPDAIVFGLAQIYLPPPAK